MYLDSFEEFSRRAEELYTSCPLKTRYVLKYRHCDGKVVLKVTNDVVVSHNRCLHINNSLLHDNVFCSA